MAAEYTKEQIKSGVNSVILEALRIDKSKLNGSSRFFLDLDAESLDILDIRFSIEQFFGIKISENEIVESIANGAISEEFKEKFTVKSLIEFVENKLKTTENVH
jgi:acyl carrier protein